MEEFAVLITEVRVKLMEDNNERLLGFCSVTFDRMFVIRDLKIIEGTKGSFVAMPSRKLTDRCECGCKNHLRARFCNYCGLRMDENRALVAIEGRAKLHADIAHPINSQCRDIIQKAIIKAYQEERERAKNPNYVCRYDEVDAGDYEDVPHEAEAGNILPFRVHGPHPHSGAHAPTGRLVNNDDREFGSGIL